MVSKEKFSLCDLVVELLRLKKMEASHQYMIFSNEFMDVKKVLLRKVADMRESQLAVTGAVAQLSQKCHSIHTSHCKHFLASRRSMMAMVEDQSSLPSIEAVLKQLQKKKSEASESIACPVHINIVIYHCLLPIIPTSLSTPSPKGQKLKLASNEVHWLPQTESIVGNQTDARLVKKKNTTGKQI